MPLSHWFEKQGFRKWMQHPGRERCRTPKSSITGHWWSQKNGGQGKPTRSASVVAEMSPVIHSRHVSTIVKATWNTRRAWITNRSQLLWTWWSHNRSRPAVQHWAWMEHLTYVELSKVLKNSHRPCQDPANVKFQVCKLRVWYRIPGVYKKFDGSAHIWANVSREEELVEIFCACHTLSLYSVEYTREDMNSRHCYEE